MIEKKMAMNATDTISMLQGTDFKDIRSKTNKSIITGYIRKIKLIHTLLEIDHQEIV